MADDRCFSNPFPDYGGEKLLDDHGKLKQQYETKLKSATENLLSKLNQRAEDDGRDYSVYTGSAGQVLLHLHLCSVLNDKQHLKTALKWLKPCILRLKKSRVSFLCGDAGPLALAAVLFSKLGDDKLSKDYISRLESMCQDVCDDETLPDELLYGRCGYLSALLFVKKELGAESVRTDAIIEVVNAVIQSGQQFARRHHCEHPLMYEWHDKPYLGAAHGLVGIYYILLQVDESSVQQRIHELVRPCIDFLLTLRFASGNCPSSIGSSSGDKLVHWCHGAPGWVHLFALAYKTFKDQKYLKAAIDCGEVVWKRGLLSKGYGLCHGAAGNAYTFLTLYKLTGQERYIYYAYQFAEWCGDYGKHGCRTPDRPYSMFEGLAGTVYFLADMLNPLKSNFPAFQFSSV